MCDLIVLVPDHCLSFYFAIITGNHRSYNVETFERLPLSVLILWEILKYLLFLKLFKSDDVIKMHGAQYFLFVLFESLY